MFLVHSEIVHSDSITVNELYIRGNLISFGSLYVHDHSRISSAVFEFRKTFLQQVKARKTFISIRTKSSFYLGTELLFTLHIR